MATLTAHETSQIDAANAPGRPTVVFPRGVLPLPLATGRSVSPVLRNPANHGKVVSLTYKVDTTNPDRGPLLIISGEQDHTVPPAIPNASYRRQGRNPGMTEIKEIAGRGHALTIDSGWRELARTALDFVRTHLPPAATTAGPDESASPPPS